MTYRYDDAISNTELRERVLADTGRMVAPARELDPPAPATLDDTLRKRGAAHRMTGDLSGAVDDYTKTLATAGDTGDFLLGRRTRVHADTGRTAKRRPI